MRISPGSERVLVATSEAEAAHRKNKAGSTHMGCTVSFFILFTIIVLTECLTMTLWKEESG